MREVEAQAPGRDERALLHRLRAQHAAQRRVEQVRARVIAHGRGARRGVDLELRARVDVDLALRHAAAVHDQLADGALGVLDLRPDRRRTRITPRSPTWPPPSA